MKSKVLFFNLSVCSAAMMSSNTLQANEQLAASLCDYVAADDKNRIRKKMKETRIKLRSIYDGVSCGGNSLIRHAVINNADKAGTFIVKQISKADLAKSGDADWADANGYSSSAIIATLKTRAGI